jgi:hypothetical protein
MPFPGINTMRRKVEVKNKLSITFVILSFNLKNSQIMFDWNNFLSLASPWVVLKISSEEKRQSRYFKNQNGDL